MIRLLTPDDIPAAMRLKEAAGWNQTEQDWEMVMRMAPQGCFGLEHEGELAATTTAVTYGRDLAWIGMVLTTPQLRGRGFARALMECAIDYLVRYGVAWIKLDATDMGYPLYRSLGFEDESAVERWLRPAGVPLSSGIRYGGFALRHWRELDLEAFGADRSELLEALAEGRATDLEGGFAMSRPGSKAAYFGPCVARGPEAARKLLAWAIATQPEGALFWDLLPHNAAALELARESGFECRRKLVRMVRRGAPGGDPFTHNDDCVFALAGFEYG